jgi:hypothetical protein
MLNKTTANSSTASIAGFQLTRRFIFKTFSILSKVLLRLFAYGSGQFQFPQRRG